MALSPLREFLRSQAAGGALLAAAASIGLLAANSPAAGLYEGVLHQELAFSLGPIVFAKSLFHWINDGLMVLFFLAVGLEIKRELLQGELSSRRRAILPAVAALGGMAVPALVFLLFNTGTDTARGWAIPMATDIAFAIAVVTLLRERVSPSLKAFLLALAIIDDLGAILVITVFYTENLSLPMLALACVWIALLVAFNRLGVTRLAPYVVVGLLLWAAVLKSGVHATLAGVILGATIPLHGAPHTRSPLRRMERGLEPWIAFLVLPLFAFANAGVSLGGFSFDRLIAPLPLGIAMGLFLGKPLGVAGASWLAVRLGIAHLPRGARGAQLFGVAVVTGIGFTMSLFMGNLAFPGGEHDAEIRLGVLIGSLLSALAGYLLLRFAAPHH